jgi:leader peptidase (prepilin peptidase)/N-methyltransferase
MNSAVFAAAVGVLLAVAVIDARTRRIPDILVIALAVIGVISAGVRPEIGAPARIAGAFIAGAPFFIIALMREGAFGGGDVKLMTAAGILLGWRGAVIAALLTLAAGGVYGAVLPALRGKDTEGRPDGRAGVRFALGPFLAASVVIAMLSA